MPAADQRVVGSLVATGPTNAVVSSASGKVQVLLSNVWVGSVALEVDRSGVWIATGDIWTSNGSFLIDGLPGKVYRLNFTRTSGTLDFDLTGD